MNIYERMTIMVHGCVFQATRRDAEVFRLDMLVIARLIRRQIGVPTDFAWIIRMGERMGMPFRESPVLVTLVNQFTDFCEEHMSLMFDDPELRHIARLYPFVRMALVALVAEDEVMASRMLNLAWHDFSEPAPVDSVNATAQVMRTILD